VSKVTLLIQRKRLGLIIILLHVAYIFLYLSFGVTGQVPLKYIVVLLGIIVPPIAVSAKAVVDYAIRNPIKLSDEDQPEVSFLFMVVPYIFVFSHAALVVAALIAFSTGKFTVEQVGSVLGVGETAFAVYLGMFVKELFDEKGQQII